MARKCSSEEIRLCRRNKHAKVLTIFERLRRELRAKNASAGLSNGFSGMFIKNDRRNGDSHDKQDKVRFHPSKSALHCSKHTVRNMFLLFVLCVTVTLVS